ncbi:MAG: chromate transporter [Thermoleophilaceae bacterium]|nr:chromate transporter [Thermoleophilaceae bacterium]
MSRPPEPVAFREAFRFWLKLGFINFGGPSGQISLMHEELVERRKWIGEGRFLHALSFCMLLPGPEAQQLAIYVGWLLHKVRGGIVAGLFFILPSFFLMLVLSWAYAAHGRVIWVAGLFAGLSAGVVGMVVVALLRIGQRAVNGVFPLTVAIASFASIFIFGVPFPLVIAGAGVSGYALSRLRPGLVAIPSELTDDGGAVIDDAAASAPHTLPSARRTVKVLLVGAAAWWVPLLAIILWRGTSDTLAREALFFGSATVVTFGGAYAVLAYVNQAAVYRFGWLTPGGVAAGLGLAESTPGPLIMVTEFVGFLAAYRFHGDLSPLIAGIIGACVTVWATFAPCFLWIFLGAPYVERLRGNRRLGAALGAITSAVVGVIGSLALSFGINVVFATVTLRRPFGAVIPVPTPRSVIWFSLAVAAVSFAVVRSRKVSPVIVVLVCGVAGLIRAVTR